MYNSNYFFPNRINNNNKSQTAKYSHQYQNQYLPKQNINSSNANIFHFSKDNSNNKNSQYNLPQYFEIFGIKVDFDDLLIICILFFLFEEGIQDFYLFIALALLLLS